MSRLAKAVPREYSPFLLDFIYKSALFVQTADFFLTMASMIRHHEKTNTID
jgi:hypothetical protein